MRSLHSKTFTDLFRSLGHDEQLALIAAIWRARGYETSVEGKHVIAVDDERSLRIAVLRRWGAGRSREDLIIGRGNSIPIERGDNEVAFMSASQLGEVFFYGIEREIANTIAENHFDISITEFQNGGTRRAGQRHQIRNGIVIILVLGVIVLTVSGIYSNYSRDIPLDGSTFVEIPANANSVENMSEFPAGLGPEGITDPVALIESHRSQLSGHSFTMRRLIEGPAVLGVQLADGRQTTVRHLTTLRMETASRYFFSVDRRTIIDNEYHETRLLSYREGNTVHGLIQEQNETTTVYNSSYRIRPDHYRRGARTIRGEGLAQMYDTEELIIRLLATGNSEIETVNQTSDEFDVSYRVIATGEPESFPGEIVEYQAIVYITDDGRIVEVFVTYTYRDTGDPVRIIIVYSEVGHTTVDQPKWVGQ